MSYDSEPRKKMTAPNQPAMTDDKDALLMECLPSLRHARWCPIAELTQDATCNCGVADLRARITAALEDAGRLDWLEGGNVYHMEIQAQPDGRHIFSGHGSGLRAAIDAARKSGDWREE